MLSNLTTFHHSSLCSDYSLFSATPGVVHTLPPLPAGDSESYVASGFGAAVRLPGRFSAARNTCTFDTRDEPSPSACAFISLCPHIECEIQLSSPLALHNNFLSPSNSRTNINQSPAIISSCRSTARPPSKRRHTRIILELRGE
ncbi:hypothetical protein MSAN_00252800 [Mycena sanguinolenta]|uniref:Uncharacterized protein n=1 Tax=Mycena sanguinolenta TaxID=230812 RepID=A0A8H6ZJ51_9AGAR|nr:hypothetical protein MSAN_00252800 [Mycena sanguinolenta]